MGRSPGYELHYKDMSLNGLSKFNPANWSDSYFDTDGFFDKLENKGGFMSNALCDALESDLREYANSRKKTVRDYLCLIKHPFDKLALKYLTDNNKHYIVETKHEALELAFWWDETDMDTQFWVDLYHALRDPKKEYPEAQIPIECIDGPAKGMHKVKSLDVLVELAYCEEVAENDLQLKTTMYQKIGTSLVYEHVKTNDGRWGQHETRLGNKGQIIRLDPRDCEEVEISSNKYEILVNVKYNGTTYKGYMRNRDHDGCFTMYINDVIDNEMDYLFQGFGPKQKDIIRDKISNIVNERFEREVGKCAEEYRRRVKQAKQSRRIYG